MICLTFYYHKYFSIVYKCRAFGIFRNNAGWYRGEKSKYAGDLGKGFLTKIFCQYLEKSCALCAWCGAKSISLEISKLCAISITRPLRQTGQSIGLPYRLCFMIHTSFPHLECYDNTLCFQSPHVFRICSDRLKTPRPATASRGIVILIFIPYSRQST